MTLTNASGPGVAHPEPATTIRATGQQHDPDDRATRRVPVASAASYAPAGRRRMVLLLVLHCPFCRCAHAHRGAEYGGLRRAGCGGGEYLIRPVTAARVPA
jgi:hypothetical protein